MIDEIWECDVWMAVAGQIRVVEYLRADYILKNLLGKPASLANRKRLDDAMKGLGWSSRCIVPDNVLTKVYYWEEQQDAEVQPDETLYVGRAWDEVKRLPSAGWTMTDHVIER